MGTISIDAGVVTGATSITSTAFVGNITGTVATATQNSITTATGLVSVGALDSGSVLLQDLVRLITEHLTYEVQQSRQKLPLFQKLIRWC